MIIIAIIAKHINCTVHCVTKQRKKNTTIIIMPIIMVNITVIITLTIMGRCTVIDFPKMPFKEGSMLQVDRRIMPREESVWMVLLIQRETDR